MLKSAVLSVSTVFLHYLLFSQLNPAVYSPLVGLQLVSNTAFAAVAPQQEAFSTLFSHSGCFLQQTFSSLLFLQWLLSPADFHPTSWLASLNESPSSLSSPRSLCSLSSLCMLKHTRRSHHCSVSPTHYCETPVSDLSSL